MAQFARFAGLRVASAALTLFLVSIVIFSAIHLLPGSYAEVFLGAHSTPQAQARIEKKFGLDRPLPIQYVKWISAAARGDFGVSLVTQHPVASEFGNRMPVTAQLAVMATVISLIIGIPMGIIGGLSQGRRATREISRLSGSLAMSVPDFVIGSVLVYIFSTYSLGLKVGSWVSLFTDPVGNFQSMILPALALSALGIGFIMTTARHATISVLDAPWIMAAVARGESFPGIIRGHVVKNAAIPVVTVVAIYFGYLLGGTVIVESLFTTPGLGRYIVQAVGLRDYPVVQAGVLIAAVVFVVLNMAADLVYAALDPRIRA